MFFTHTTIYTGFHTHSLTCTHTHTYYGNKPGQPVLYNIKVKHSLTIRSRSVWHVMWKIKYIEGNGLRRGRENVLQAASLTTTYLQKHPAKTLTKYRNAWNNNKSIGAVVLKKVH